MSVIIEASGKNSYHDMKVNGVSSFKIHTSDEYKIKNMKVFFEVENHSFLYYEKGFIKSYERKIKIKDGIATFKFDGFTYDMTAMFPDYFAELTASTKKDK